MSRCAKGMPSPTNSRKKAAATRAPPARSLLLVERVRTREGHHLFVFPFEGR